MVIIHDHACSTTVKLYAIYDSTHMYTGSNIEAEALVDFYAVLLATNNSASIIFTPIQFWSATVAAVGFV